MHDHCSLRIVCSYLPFLFPPKAEDPLTGQDVELLTLGSTDESTEESAWLFENFSVEALTEYQLTKDPSNIVRRMRGFLLMAITLELTFLAALVAFIRMLTDPALSILPIISVIGAGQTGRLGANAIGSVRQHCDTVLCTYDVCVGWRPLQCLPVHVRVWACAHVRV